MTTWMAWAGTVCMAAAGCAALQIPVGESGMGKPFRLVTAAFFLCAILLPLSSLRGIPSLPTQTETALSAEELEELAFRQMVDMTQEIVLAEVNGALANYDLKAERAEIRMDSSADGGISITEIVLYVSPQNSLHRTWVKQIAEQRLGTEVEVQYAQ